MFQFHFGAAQKDEAPDATSSLSQITMPEAVAPTVGIFDAAG